MEYYFLNRIGYLDIVELKYVTYNIRIDIMRAIDKIRKYKILNELMLKDPATLYGRYHIYLSRKTAINELENWLKELKEEHQRIEYYRFIKKSKKYIEIEF